MKVALVHDYLNEFGGAERVLLALSEMYPEAPIYTTYYKKNSVAYTHFSNKKLIQSWFGKLPFAHALISPLRFLVPFMWASFDFSEYDIVITSASWAVTKGVRKGAHTKEICYLHTPPRYLYGYDTSRNWQTKWFAGLVRVYAAVVNHFMRMYDFAQAQKVDLFIVNSENVGKRVEKFYRRTDYQVIYPPVEIKKSTKYNTVSSSKKEYYLTGGRLVAAKNFDLIIKACNSAKKPLKVFGTGIEERYLRSIAGPTVEILGRVDDEQLEQLYQGAKAFIAAQKDEDFGITVVESQALGCPAIVYKAEGYLETIVEGKTGVFFEKLSESSLANALKKFESMKFDSKMCIKQAEKFSKQNFQKKINSSVTALSKRSS